MRLNLLILCHGCAVEISLFSRFSFHMAWHASMHRFYPHFHYFQLSFCAMRSSVLYYQIDNINIDWIRFQLSISFSKLNHMLMNKNYRGKGVLEFSFRALPNINCWIKCVQWHNDNQSFRFVSVTAFVSVRDREICWRWAPIINFFFLEKYLK